MKSVYWKFYVVVAFRVWFRNLAKDQIRDTVALFPIGTKYARSEIWYRIGKTLNLYKLKNNLPLLFGIKHYWFDKLHGSYFFLPQNHWLFYS